MTHIDFTTMTSEEIDATFDYVSPKTHRKRELESRNHIEFFSEETQISCEKFESLLNKYKEHLIGKTTRCFSLGYIDTWYFKNVIVLKAFLGWGDDIYYVYPEINNIPMEMQGDLFK